LGLEYSRGKSLIVARVDARKKKKKRLGPATLLGTATPPLCKSRKRKPKPCPGVAVERRSAVLDSVEGKFKWVI